MPTDGQNLCLSCGLCCDGTLFARSSVDATEPVEAFRSEIVRYDGWDRAARVPRLTGDR